MLTLQKQRLSDASILSRQGTKGLLCSATMVALHETVCMTPKGSGSVSIKQLLALTPIILSTLVSIMLFVLAWKERKERGGGALLLFLAGAGLWSLADWMSMVSTNSESSLMWTRILYVGVCTVPAGWFLFALRYTGRIRREHYWRAALLAVEPVLVQAVIWTNESHRLFWVDSTYRVDTLFPTVENVYGPLFWVHTVYSYLLIFSGMLILLRMAYRRRGLQSNQAITLMLAVILPLMGNIAFLSGIRLFGFVDITAPTFTLAAIFLFISISRFKLFRALPVTRDDVFSSLDMGILLLTEDGRVVDCNTAASRLLGMEPGRSEGKQILHIFPEWQALEEDLCKAEGRAVPYTLSFGGEERIFEVECVSEKVATSNQTRIILFHDITQHVRAEEELQESKDRFRMLFEYAPSPYYIFDMKGVFRDGNREAERLSGYSREEVIGKSLHEIPLLEGQHFDLALNVLMQLKQGQNSPPLETKLKTRNGELIPIEVHFYPIELGGEAVVLGVANDVRERVATQSALEREVEARTWELEEANRDLQLKALELERTIKGLKRFAYVASHDLQEPLRMVSCYTQLLQDSYEGQLDPTADEYIGYAVEGAKRMQNLIRDLVKFTRLIEPRGEKLPVDCNILLDDLKHEMVEKIDSTGAVIQTGDLPTLLAYDGQLRQLFYHLVDNALKFQPEHPPRVTIEAKQVDSTWAFSVEDNGIGIESHFHDRIFEIFRRLHGQKVYPGTGLGLALCKQIVENHTGRIWVESEPGTGSTFWFTWPVHAEET